MGGACSRESEPSRRARKEAEEIEGQVAYALWMNWPGDLSPREDLGELKARISTQAYWLNGRAVIVVRCPQEMFEACRTRVAEDKTVQDLLVAYGGKVEFHS